MTHTYDTSNIKPLLGLAPTRLDELLSAHPHTWNASDWYAAVLMADGGGQAKTRILSALYEAYPQANVHTVMAFASQASPTH